MSVAPSLLLIGRHNYYYCRYPITVNGLGRELMRLAVGGVRCVAFESKSFVWTLVWFQLAPFEAGVLSIPVVGCCWLVCRKTAGPWTTIVLGVESSTTQQRVDREQRNRDVASGRFSFHPSSCPRRRFDVFQQATAKPRERKAPNTGGGEVSTAVSVVEGFLFVSVSWCLE